MKKYLVTVELKDVALEIEADNEDDAVDKAIESALEMEPQIFCAGVRECEE